jgi:hypothetical protein
LFKSCISFCIRVVYDVEKERPSQELWESTFVKLKKTNFLPLLSKGKHRCIPPPLGILLYNCHYVIVACAFTLQELNETLECIIPFVYDLDPIVVENPLELQQKLSGSFHP